MTAIEPRWPRFVAGLAANICGLLCVIWPVLPQHWGAWEFVGRLFHAATLRSLLERLK